MRKYDKSLTEVWEWKEKVYDGTKGSSSKDYIRKMKNDADVVLSGNKVKLRSIAFGNRKRVA
jgi:hypothetical protein